MLILVMVPINQSYGSNSVKSVRVPAHVIFAMCFCEGSESLAAMPACRGIPRARGAVTITRCASSLAAPARPLHVSCIARVQAETGQ